MGIQYATASIPPVTAYLEVVQEGWQCNTHVVDAFRSLDIKLYNTVKSL
jgi:hypothetical protein